MTDMTPEQQLRQAAHDAAHAMNEVRGGQHGHYAMIIQATRTELALDMTWEWYWRTLAADGKTPLAELGGTGSRHVPDAAVSAAGLAEAAAEEFTVPVPPPGSFPWDQPDADPVGDIHRMKHAEDARMHPLGFTDPAGCRRCPDAGMCHHQCARGCFRVLACGPFSGYFHGDEWPAPVLEANRREER